MPPFASGPACRCRARACTGEVEQLLLVLGRQLRPLAARRPRSRSGRQASRPPWNSSLSAFVAAARPPRSRPRPCRSPSSYSGPACRCRARACSPRRPRTPRGDRRSGRSTARRRDALGAWVSRLATLGRRRSSGCTLRRRATTARPAAGADGPGHEEPPGVGVTRRKPVGCHLTRFYAEAVKDSETGRAPTQDVERQADLEPGAAGRAVGGRDRAAVALDDPLGDREAEAGAARRARRRPPEPVEDARQVLGRMPRPVVVDGQDGAAVDGLPDGDAHGPAARRGRHGGSRCRPG